MCIHFLFLRANFYFLPQIILYGPLFIFIKSLTKLFIILDLNYNFSILSNTIVSSSYNNEGNKNFNETENAAKAIRKLLNGEIDTIKLENGDELKIKSSNNIQEDYSWKNNNRQL
ncbi:hypothetical protein YYC_02338 [Plasmodium yoelii 17X]|uniref:Uncharacterized protein n=2 Tax=Plasmodium yoelii TaxID=5861 RepID=Q7RPL3_PLAYO|nr:hypothetical protein [Plasmodium yoelii yoelii]ETB60729.1 hypothetical protein YYC_02338 [Plasmodium yoelii 17X]